MSDANPSEKEWVIGLRPQIEQALVSEEAGAPQIRVEAHKKLGYANEIQGYEDGLPSKTHTMRYETDLLISSSSDSKTWVPRVVIECKTWSVTSHDALTYSAKAATHKHVHPYLRYGILIGNYGKAVPARLIRHGAHFDYMMVWNSPVADPEEWADFIDVMRDEVRASLTMQKILVDRTKARATYRLVHKPLRLK